MYTTAHKATNPSRAHGQGQTKNEKQKVWLGWCRKDTSVDSVLRRCVDRPAAKHFPDQRARNFRTNCPDVSGPVAGMPDISRQLFPDVSRSWLPDTCDQCWPLMSGSTIARHLRLMLVGCVQKFAINVHKLLYNCMAVCLALAARALRVCGERTACEMNSRVHFGAPTP